MGKLDDYNVGRTDGLLLALKIVRNGGLEALDEEIKFRNQTKINTTLAKKELEKASEPIKMRILDTVLTMSCMVLRDEFGFGGKRIEQFCNRFNSKSECLTDNMLSWQDMTDTLKEETGVELKIRYEDL